MKQHCWHNDPDIDTAGYGERNTCCHCGMTITRERDRGSHGPHAPELTLPFEAYPQDICLMRLSEKEIGE